MSFPEKKKIRILSVVTMNNRNQDQIQSIKKQNDYCIPQQKIIRNNSNYEQGTRQTLRPHNQIPSNEFGLSLQQLIQPNRLNQLMKDKSQQNIPQRNASIKFISSQSLQTQNKFKDNNKEDKFKMAIKMSSNEQQLNQSQQKHLENQRQLFKRHEIEILLQQHIQQPSNQSRHIQQQQQYQQQSFQQQQQQQQSKQQQKQLQQQEKEYQEYQQQYQSYQQLLLQQQQQQQHQQQQHQQQQQQQQQQHQQQKQQQYIKQQQQQQQHNQLQQYQESDQEEEQNLAKTIFQTVLPTCFKCKTQISRNIYSLKCWHLYHKECFLELVSNQILQNNYIPNIYCFCKIKISTSLLKDLGANKGELEEKLFEKQLRILRINYQQIVISCNLCDYFCINDQKFKNKMVCQNDHDIYKKTYNKN